MAFDKKKYPPYWKQFSEYIRFERAGGKCERCGVENGFLKIVSPYLDNGFEIVSPDDAAYLHEIASWLFDTTPVPRRSKIVLTVAHLDHAGGVCRCKKIFGFKCAKPSHVRALCQSCHLTLDRPKHLAVQAKNRVIKKDAARALLNLV